MEPNEDRPLIIGLKNGNRRCFEKLFLKYYPRFRAFMFRIVRDEFVVEDMLQNIFMKLWDKRATLDENLSLVAYIYVAAKYEVYNYLRYTNAHTTISLTDARGDVDQQSRGVDEEYDYAELSAQITATIAAMPPQRRKIFTMNRYEFLSAKEIAAQLGLSPRTVEKHLELAIKTIRQSVSRLTLLTVLLLLTIA